MPIRRISTQMKPFRKTIILKEVPEHVGETLLRGWLMVAVLGMLPAFGAEAGDAAPPKGRAVKVLTYNIAHGVGHDGRLDLDRIAGVIRRERCGCGRSPGGGQTLGCPQRFCGSGGGIGGKVEHAGAVCPIYSLDPPEPGKPRREYGLAILSRYPITRFKNHELSRISSLEPEKGVQKLPGFPEAVINLHGRKIHLFNTHLSWLDPEVRLLEAEEMLEIMGSARHPVVLAGTRRPCPMPPKSTG